MKCAAAFLLTAALAWSDTVTGELTVTGPSDFVGVFTISGNSVPTISGYGGAFQGTIQNTQPSGVYLQLLFCDDFSNDVSIPSQPVQVDITSLTAGASFVNDTRFGAVTSWQPISSSLPSGDTLDPGVENTLDAATSLQRYEMAAYLMSNYSFFNSGLPPNDMYYSDATSTGIQSAIWDILNPSSDLYQAPGGGQDGDVTTWLTAAANWLPNANSAANQALLSPFRIVSDVAISQAPDSQKTQVGIQEFLTIVNVPEPGAYGILSAALGVLFCAIRRRSASPPAPVPHSPPRG